MAKFSEFWGDYQRGSTTRGRLNHLVAIEPGNEVALCGVYLHGPSLTDYEPTVNPQDGILSPEVCPKCAKLARAALQAHVGDAPALPEPGTEPGA